MLTGRNVKKFQITAGFSTQIENDPNTMGDYFAKTFLVGKSEKGNYGVKPGGFVEVDKTQIIKLLPEGVVDGVNSEFEFSDSSELMVRDSGKFLCRILDDFVAGKGQQLGLSKVVKSIESNLTMTPLTVREEWDSAKMSVKYFGKELVQKPDTFKDNTVCGGEGSLVDKCLVSLGTESSGAFPKHILLTGDRGTGKSVALTQMVVHARLSGWLCLYVPKGWEQVHRGLFVRPLDEHVYGPQLYDNTYQSAEVLRGFWRAHREQLSALPVRNPEAFSKYRPMVARFTEEWDRAARLPGRDKLDFMDMRVIVEQESEQNAEEDAKDEDVLQTFSFHKFQEPQTIGDLIKFGVAFRDCAGSIFMDVMAELQQVTEMPVLVAVDEYNAWETDSAFSYMQVPVHGRDICVPRTLNFFTQTNAKGKPSRLGLAPPPIYSLQNGICVGATSLRTPECKHMTFNQSSRSVDLALRVPNYSQVEYLSAVSHYCHRDVVSGEMDDQHFLAFRTHAGSNPEQMRRQLTPYFFPRSVKAETARMKETPEEAAARVLAEQEAEDSVESGVTFTEEEQELLDSMTPEERAELGLSEELTASVVTKGIGKRMTPAAAPSDKAGETGDEEVELNEDGLPIEYFDSDDEEDSEEGEELAVSAIAWSSAC